MLIATGTGPHLFWITSRAAGTAALILSSVSVSIGLLMGGRFVKRRGHDLRVVDTGGIVPEEKDFIPAEIFRQARVAFEEAAANVMVVDGRSELAAPDLELARLLQKTGKPLFLAVNKVDSVKQESLANDFHGLGIREIFPISAEHGRGIDDLLDAVVSLLTATNLSTATETDAKDKVRNGQSKRSASRARKSAKSESPPFPKKGKDGAPADLVLSHDERRVTHDGFAADEEQTTDDDPAEGRASVAESDIDNPTRETRVAIIGHPNVGKSTLLNRLTGADRAIVSPVPGTTRDAVDEIVERDGNPFRFIDTAGIRRKGKTHLMAEKLSVVMARKHLEAADIALLVIDATAARAAVLAQMATKSRGLAPRDCKIPKKPATARPMNSACDTRSSS